MSDFDLVVTGTVVLADRIIEDGWVAVSGKRIAAVGRGVAPGSAVRHGGRGAWVFPGVIDSQVHSYSIKGQEGFERSTRAAAAGGVTTICDMPFDEGELISTPERFRSKRKRVAIEAHVDVALFATIHPSDGVRYIREMAELGACSFKFSSFEVDPERFPRTPPLLMFEAFEQVAQTGLVACVHNENQEIINQLVDSAGKGGVHGPGVHAWSRPPLNEVLAMAEIYEIGAAAGVHSHVVHCSVPRGIEICEAYKRMGYRASVEVLLPHLFLAEEDVERLVGFAKINPPIRTTADREGLWHHLTAGHIDLVSTDHVIYPLERKNHPEMLKNGSGLPGLELLLPLLLTGCLNCQVSMPVAARVLAFNPARHLLGSFQRSPGARCGRRYRPR